MGLLKLQAEDPERLVHLLRREVEAAAEDGPLAAPRAHGLEQRLEGEHMHGAAVDAHELERAAHGLGHAHDGYRVDGGAPGTGNSVDMELGGTDPGSRYVWPVGIHNPASADPAYRKLDVGILIFHYIRRRILYTTKTEQTTMKIFMTIQPEPMQDPVSNLVICDCIDGVLAIGEETKILHTKSLENVVKMYSQVFDCLQFLKTSASTKELAWLATQQRNKNVLWMLAASTMPRKCRSFIEIFAIAIAETLAFIETKKMFGDIKLDNALRGLRWRLQTIRKEAQDAEKIPGLSPLQDVMSCACKVVGFDTVIVRGKRGSWKKASGREETLVPDIAVEAFAEQMLWLSQYTGFSSVLATLQEQERFGSTNILKS